MIATSNGVTALALASTALGGCIAAAALAPKIEASDVAGTIHAGAVAATRGDDLLSVGGGGATTSARVALGEPAQQVRFQVGLTSELGGERGPGWYTINGVDIGGAVLVPRAIVDLTVGAYAGGLTRLRTTVPVRVGALVDVGAALIDAEAWAGWRIRTDSDTGVVEHGPLGLGAWGGQVGATFGGDARRGVWIGLRWEDWDGTPFGVLGVGLGVATTRGLAPPADVPDPGSELGL